MLRFSVLVVTTFVLTGCLISNEARYHNGLLRSQESSAILPFYISGEAKTFDPAMPKCRARIGERGEEWDELCAKNTERELEREQRTEDLELKYYYGDYYNRGRLFLPR